MNKLFLAMLLLVAGGCSQTYNVWQLKNETYLGSKIDSLRIFNLNTHGIPFTKSIKRMEDIIAKKTMDDYEVITLQEVFKARAKELITSCEVWQNNAILSENSPGSGLATLTKFHVIEKKYLTFSKKRGWDFFTNKGALATLLRVDTKLIWIINVHLQSDREKVTKSQLDELADFINLFGENIPMVVIGDFNLCGISEKSKVENFLQKTKLTMPFLQNHTWDECNTLCSTYESKRLDFALYKGQIDLTDKVLEHKNYSDHFGTEIKIIFKKEETSVLR